MRKMSKNRSIIKLFIFIIMLLFLLLSCEEKKEIAKKVIIKPKPIKKVEKSVDNKSSDKEAIFVYETKDLRNPFTAFVEIQSSQDDEEENIPQTPLTMYSIEQIKLKGIMGAKGKNRVAMFETQDGLGLFVKSGDYLGIELFKVIDVSNLGVFLEKKNRGQKDIQIVKKEFLLDEQKGEQ